MHTQDARARGESEQRLYLLAAWQESPFYNERERAALLWTEAVTFVAERHVPDDTYQAVRQAFSEDELVSLTWAVATINAWNRICVGLRSPVGTYRPTASAHGIALGPMSTQETRGLITPRISCHT